MNVTLTWLAADLRAAGLDVREIDGWQTRAVPGPFAPLGVLIHHTAGPPAGDAPSLQTCTHGRSDLAGPLCQLLIARSGAVYLIAGGRANHAGAGVLPLVPTNTGNSLLVGIEMENTGTETWPAGQVLAAQIAAAVVLRKAGPADRAPRVWGHKEYAPGRKPDPAGIDMTQFRAAVARILTAGGPVPESDYIWQIQQVLANEGLYPADELDGHAGPKLLGAAHALKNAYHDALGQRDAATAQLTAQAATLAAAQAEVDRLKGELAHAGGPAAAKLATLLADLAAAEAKAKA